MTRVLRILRTADVVEWALMFLVALWLPLLMLLWMLFA